MDYLFWAHIVFWILLFVYVFTLYTKYRGLKSEFENAKSIRSNKQFHKTNEHDSSLQKRGVK